MHGLLLTLSVSLMVLGWIVGGRWIAAPGDGVIHNADCFARGDGETGQGWLGSSLRDPLHAERQGIHG